MAVVGAGVGGLAAAIRLAERGCQVTVFDPQSSPGGLAGGFQVGGGSVERFYHHIFRSDSAAARWINEVGLGGRLEYLPASMGYFHQGRMFRFGTPLSLLTFAPLPVADRVRLGLRVRRLSSDPTPDAYEHLTAMDWLRERCSRAELEVFWIPLLEAKFGGDRDLVSMAWLWARFRARVGGSAGRAERLGYLRGGFQQLSDAMAARAVALGVQMALGDGVQGLVVEDGRIRGVRSSVRGVVDVDAAVWTPSLKALAAAVPELEDSYRERCASIRYHHALVMVVELERSVLPYYWVTVGDRDLPFTVAVEHTRLVGTEDYGGRTLVYLGRYAPPGDPLLEKSDDEIRETFLAAAARAFNPGFATPLASHVFRGPSAQPIVTPGWATSVPSLRTGLPGLVAANMAQIYPWDRGINYSVALGESASDAVIEELAATRAPVT